MSRLEEITHALVATLKTMAIHPSHYADLEAWFIERDAEREAHEDTIEAARNNYCNDDIEIDDAPALSIAEGGVWVAAWVWVPIEDEENEGEEA